MPGEHFFRKEDLVSILESCLNKTLGEVDVNHVFDRTINHPKITGIAGDVIEHSVLGYPPDTRQEPDLNIDGILTELKTTGIRLVKNRRIFEAKEPMSITAVSPARIVEETFDNSNFWHKLEHMLLVYYLYAAERTVTAAEYANFPIKGYEFHEFSETDRLALKNDWLIVKNFIEHLQSEFTDYENQYPRISSELRSQLFYIDTAPKWPNNPRFRLKRTVVTSIVQNHFGTNLEQLPGRYTTYTDIDSRCHELTERYRGKTIGDLVSYFGLTTEKMDKSIGEKIIVRMFDGRVKKMQQIELFHRIGLSGKTITLTRKGLRTEDTKLFAIDFEELQNPDLLFDESSFRDYFANSQMLCIVFEEPNKQAPLTENVFMGFKRITFDNDFLENSVKPVWDRIRYLIFNNELRDVVSYDRKGNPIVNKTGVIKSAPNFPKSVDGLVFVRGTGSNSNGKREAVNGITMYSSQDIWIKGTYIVKRLSESEFL